MEFQSTRLEFIRELSIVSARDLSVDQSIVHPVETDYRVCVVTAHDLIADLISSAFAARGLTVVHSPDANFESVARSHRGCDVVVICSWAVPRQGRHLTRSLVSAHPGTRVVIIDDSHDEHAASPFLASGAMAVIGRHVSLLETVDVIVAACRGDSLVRTPSAETTIRETNGKASLSRRETEILQLAVDGFDISTMARRLYISEKTVKHHLSAIYTKLGATNRTDAVVRGLRLGLVELRAD